MPDSGGYLAGTAVVIERFRLFRRRRLAYLVWVAAALTASPAIACTPSATLSDDAGSVSPAAIAAGKVPPIKLNAGLTCPNSVLVLLGSNYVKGKLNSANSFKLKRGDGATISYIASADTAATVPYAQNGTVDYMQNNLLDLLGLLSAGDATLPIFIKPVGGATPAPGTYTDTVTMTWDWYICQGIGALGLCVGTPLTGVAKKSVITVTLDVSVKTIVLSATTRTTWDPVSGSGQPRAVPGSRRRLTVDAFNPDLVAIDANSVAITVPLARGEAVAFDGDGSGSSTVFALSDGSPASGLSLRYTAPNSTSDDVDFSKDNGASWTFSPIPSATASVAQITHVRLRPQGSMAAGSRVSLSVPTLNR